MFLRKRLQGNVFTEKLSVFVGKAVHDRLLNDACFFQGHVSTILVDGLERACGKLDANELAELRNPDALALKVWGNFAFGDLGHVTADAALFLGQAGTVNLAAGADAGASNTTNTCHNENWFAGAKNALAWSRVKTNCERK